MRHFCCIFLAFFGTNIKCVAQWLFMEEDIGYATIERWKLVKQHVLNIWAFSIGKRYFCQNYTHAECVSACVHMGLEWDWFKRLCGLLPSLCLVWYVCHFRFFRRFRATQQIYDLFFLNLFLSPKMESVKLCSLSRFQFQFLSSRSSSSESQLWKIWANFLFLFRCVSERTQQCSIV